ncbi:MAG: glycosyltransferase family 2 protein [Acetobacteraceae bacterium]|nr:glycosyltransferase family 2 protein [Acetobacteraceae bacterium]
MNVHREGHLLQPTLNNCFDALDRASALGAQLEVLVVADAPDAATLDVLAHNAARIDRVEQVSFRDLGQSRQYGIERARAPFVFLHDADDLYSRNFYVQGLRTAMSEGFDSNALYHCQYRVDFDQEVGVTEAIASDDPEFDPQMLVVNWFFPHKGMAHRSAFERLVIPHNTHGDGFGSEDWAWGSNLIAAGGTHRILRDTIVFYRRKRPEESLGMTPGVIHMPSPLFDPAHVRATTRARATDPAIPTFAAFEADEKPLSRRRPVPELIRSELRAMVTIDSLLSGVLERLDDPRDPVRVMPPAMHRGTARAYRDICERLDGRPTLFVSISAGDLPGGDLLVEKAIAELSADGTKQLVILVDPGAIVLDAEAAHRRHGAVVISTRELRERYGVPEYRLNRLLMRLFLQLDPAVALDFGSDVLARVVAEFPKAFRTLRCRFLFAPPQPALGLYDRAFTRVQDALTGLASAGILDRAAVSLASPHALALLASTGVPVTPLPEAFTRAMRSGLSQRFHEVPARRAELLAGFDLRSLLPLLDEARPNPPGRGGLVLPLGDGPATLLRERVPPGLLVAMPEGAYVSGEVVAQLGLALARNAGASFATTNYLMLTLPHDNQIIWIDPNEPERHLQGLADDQLTHGCVPLVLVARAGRRAQEMLGQDGPVATLPFAELHRIAMRELRAGRLSVIAETVAFGFGKRG